MDHNQDAKDSHDVDDAPQSIIAQPTWTDDEEKAVVRKLDMILMPLLVLGFYALQLDRSNISNALTDTLTTDLNMTKDDVNLGDQLMMAGIIIAEIPSNIILQKLGAPIWLTGQVLIWGTVALAQAWVTNVHSFFATRFLLGFFEAGFIPGGQYMLALFYREKELALRTSIFYFGNYFATATGSLIAAGVLQMGGIAGLAGWQWLFIIEGIFTLVVFFIFILLLPRSPMHTKPIHGRFDLFTSREREIMHDRIYQEDISKTEAHANITFRGVIAALTDYRIWIHTVLNVVSLAPKGGLQLYGPTIIRSLGFSKINSNLLNSVSSFLVVFLSFAIAWASDKTKQRGLWCVVAFLWSITFGGALFGSTDKDKWTKYALFTLLSSGNALSQGLNDAWLSINTRSAEKRSIGLALVVIGSNAGGLAGKQLFRESDAPKYTKGFLAIVLLYAAALPITAAIMGVYWRQNKKLARELVQNEGDVDQNESPSPHPPQRSHSNTRRKLRNRLSQRAFRRRQAECIRELKNRVNADQRSDSERVEALQKENRLLRQQLIDVQTKMSRMMASVQLLSDSVAKTLDDTAGGERERERSEQVNGKTGNDEQIVEKASLQSIDLEAFDPSILDFDAPFSSSNVTAPSTDNGLTSELINVAGTSPFYSQIPNIWSHEYQMGMQPYLTAINATAESSMVLGKDYSFTNSPFSDHIQLLQRMLKNKLNTLGFVPEGHNPVQSVYQPVLMVLSMFNSMTRPDVMAWYAKTRFYHIIELTAWQLYPSSATFNKLHPRYRPTKAQLENPHPGIIDWIPFPTIRDRLIQLHSANPHIDQIFCDAVTGYVVEALMSDLVLGAPQITVYVRVTDLINTMSSGTSESENTIAMLPAPDISTLFSSPAYARAAFNKLNMDKGAGYYKIDPAFFEKYPELWDQASDLTATGMPLKPKYQKILTYPKPLDSSTVETYRSFIDFSLDAANTISMSP
ncbi:major facilitator superfamily domain-containing protein [Fusarium redolens]|uniref:Major facilitator superfamily domain-containing protein n=1 Tax=Fusarium redolens TaxID=48865 RepID=A0A9P9GLP5_FUSRE|nr:major facilitator superfamily domain-containing protein [Fusarium redolens]KAH7240827.1 major facilitator superfamily domain-containing protein [Fusarium redolens]